MNIRLQNTVIGNTYKIFQKALDAHVDNGTKKDGVHSLVSVTLGNGQDEQGLPTRDVRQLQPGDRVSTYTSYDEKGEYRLKQEEFVIGEDGGTLSYIPLPAGIFSEFGKEGFCEWYEGA